MKIPKLKMPYMALPVCMLPLATIGDEANYGVLTVFISFELVWVVWLVASYVADGPYIGSGMSRKEKKKELQRQRTAKLGEELGIEPLNLDELDPIFDEITKGRKRERNGE